jgi:hypothetical protein
MSVSLRKPVLPAYFGVKKYSTGLLNQALEDSLRIISIIF